MKRNQLLFKFESLLLATTATALYLWHPTSLPIQINSLIPIMLNLLLSLILINERRTVLNNLVKLPLIGLFPYSLGLSICLFGPIHFQHWYFEMDHSANRLDFIWSNVVSVFKGNVAVTSGNWVANCW